MRYIIRLMIILLVLSLSVLIGGCTSKYTAAGRDKGIDKLKGEIVAQKDKYITVGNQNCEFNTIKDALKAIDSKRNIIYIMENIHNETSIIIEDDVIIKGFGTDNSIIQGASNVELAKDRIFFVKEDGNLTLEGLTIQNGRVDKVPRKGAGILNHGKLIVDHCVIRNNVATYGVGIFSNNYLDIKNSKIIGNNSVPRPPEEERLAKGCKGSGGGIKIENGEFNITNCIISDNHSKVTGGGIKISCDAEGIITNCIISDNTSGYYGGGISCNGKMKLIHCTIINNDSHRGGGIHITGDVDMVANIIIKNTNNDFDILNSSNFSPEILRNEYNIIGDGKVQGSISSDINLKKVVDNNGDIITYSLEPKSAAIDVIPSNISFVKTDHRGIYRQDKHSDIGAYEHNKNKLYIPFYIIGSLLFIVFAYYFYKHFSTSK